jgi:hypothetical protein
MTQMQIIASALQEHTQGALKVVRLAIALLFIMPFALPHMRRGIRRYAVHGLHIVAVSLSGASACCGDYQPGFWCADDRHHCGGAAG